MPRICGDSWWTKAQKIPTQHADDRPAGVDVDAVIVHAISLPPNTFSGQAVSDFFCGKLDKSAHPYFEEIINLRVSAHIFVRRNGEILQYVPFDRRAWHAGASELFGRPACNDYSIGIELEGSDDVPFTPIQYDILLEVLGGLMEKYPKITPERVVGHCDVAPNRKTDPGPFFNWSSLRQALASAK